MWKTPGFPPQDFPEGFHRPGPTSTEFSPISTSLRIQLRSSINKDRTSSRRRCPRIPSHEPPSVVPQETACKRSFSRTIVPIVPHSRGMRQLRNLSAFAILRRFQQAGGFRHYGKSTAAAENDGPAFFPGDIRSGPFHGGGRHHPSHGRKRSGRTRSRDPGPENRPPTATTGPKQRQHLRHHQWTSRCLLC